MRSSPISVSTNIFENAGWALSDIFAGQGELGEGGDLDVPVAGAVIEDLDAARLAVAFRDDDAFDLRTQRADDFTNVALSSQKLVWQLSRLRPASVRRSPTTTRRCRHRRGTDSCPSGPRWDRAASG